MPFFISPIRYNELLEQETMLDKYHKRALEAEEKLSKSEYDAEKAKRLAEEAARRAAIDKSVTIREEVEKQTSKLTKENNELRITNERLVERTKVLEKAFENLGFDVKDMKEILNKLVDGVIAKNEIKLIK